MKIKKTLLLAVSIIASSLFAQQNNAISEYVHIKKGWNLIGTRGNIKDVSIIMSFVGVDHLFEYYYDPQTKKSEWRYSPDIAKKDLEDKGIRRAQSLHSNEGFWLYYSDDKDNIGILLYTDFYGENCTKRDGKTTYQLHKGWQIVSPTGNITDMEQIQQNSCIDLVWQYNKEKNSWSALKLPSQYASTHPTINAISAHEGVWVLANRDCNVTLKDDFTKDRCKLEPTVYIKEYDDAGASQEDTQDISSYIVLGEADTTTGKFDPYDIKNISDKPIKIVNIIEDVNNGSIIKNFKDGTYKFGSPLNCTVAFQTTDIYPYTLEPNVGYFLEDLIDGGLIDYSRTTCNLSDLQPQPCSSGEIVTEHQKITFYLSNGTSFTKERTTKLDCEE